MNYRLGEPIDLGHSFGQRYYNIKIKQSCARTFIKGAGSKTKHATQETVTCIYIHV